MLKAIDINDKKQWNEIVKSFNDYDIYYLPEYIIPFALFEKTKPHLIYYKGDNMELCYAVMKDDIAFSPKFKGHLETKKYYDLSTPYGYGGPLVKNYNEKEMALFFKELTDWAGKNNIVTQFIRFHPLLQNYVFFKNHCDLLTFKQTIYIDLTNETLLLENMKSECRTRIRKAKKNGIFVEIDNSEEAKNRFKELYCHTMKRTNATEYYFFNDDFFDELFKELGKSGNLFCAKFENKIIASMLILEENGNLHYHLGASDSAYMTLAPNNLLFYEISLYGLKNAYKKFHLGGGTGSEDSLFKFKKTFNKKGGLDFYIGRNIFNKNLYNFLMNKRKEINPDFNLNTSFLIGYRS